MTNFKMKTSIKAFVMPQIIFFVLGLKINKYNFSIKANNKKWVLLNKNLL